MTEKKSLNKLKGCYSHITDDWKTPTELYYYFIKKLGCIDCFKYQDQENEFEKIYKNEKLYVNPPFSKLKFIPNWVDKNLREGNCIIYLLIPARTDTKYFHELLKLRPEIYFIKGRLRYNDSKKPAPFPTILMLFQNFLKMRVYRTLDEIMNL